MPVTRDRIPVPVLPREAVPLDALGGDVVVQGMDLSQLLRFLAMRRRVQQPREGEGETEAFERAGAEVLPVALAWCVLADDDLPVFDVEGWRRFGAAHAGDALALFKVAMRLSGQDDVEADKKNS